MAKRKETKLVEEIREEEPLETKGPLRDEPEPAYSPAWEVVNDRQNILTDKIPPKIYSIDALKAAGLVTEEALAAYVDEKVADTLPLKIIIHTDEPTGYEEVEVTEGTTAQIINATNSGRIVWVVLPERGESYSNLYAAILTDTSIQFLASGQEDYLEFNADTLYIQQSI